jgi:hypothetical protein
MSGVPISEPISRRVKRKATKSESTLTARKKYTQYVAVTSPPDEWFEAVSPTTP